MALSLNTTNYEFREKLMQRLSRHAVLTGPASYATGGIAIDNLGDFGWSQTQYVTGIITDGTTYYDLFLDRTNQKIKAISQSTGQEVANATNLSTFSGDIVAFGR
jgi:hypothetical protein